MGREIESRDRRGGIGVFALILLSCLMLTSIDAQAGDPYRATYRRGGDRVFWFAQITDTHIDTTEEPRQRLWWACTIFRDTVEPLVLFNTGDLTDGTNGGLIPMFAPSADEWLEYQHAVDDAGMTIEIYIDAVGNHDHYNDEGNTYYLAHSVMGRAVDSCQYSLRVDLPYGPYHFFIADTTANDGRRWPFDFTQMSPFELADYANAIDENEDANLSFTLAHHSWSSVLYGYGRSEYEDLLHEAEAIYLHGHWHDTDVYLDSDILTFELNSSGKSGDDAQIAVYAVDNDALSVGHALFDDPWPLIVITAPAASEYFEGTTNPYSYSVENGCVDNPIRALAFDQAPIEDVRYRIDAEPWISMSPHPRTDHLFEGEFDGATLEEGEHLLEVQVVGSTTRSRTSPFWVVEASCTLEDETEPADGDADADSDADGDVEADGDVDGDADGDSDVDADADADSDADADEPLDADEDPVPDATASDAEVNESDADGETAPNDGEDGGCGCKAAGAPTHNWQLSLPRILDGL